MLPGMDSTLWLNGTSVALPFTTTFTRTTTTTSLDMNDTSATWMKLKESGDFKGFFLALVITSLRNSTLHEIDSRETGSIGFCSKTPTKSDIGINEQVIPPSANSLAPPPSTIKKYVFIIFYSINPAYIFFSEVGAPKRSLCTSLAAFPTRHGPRMKVRSLT